VSSTLSSRERALTGFCARIIPILLLVSATAHAQKEDEADVTINLDVNYGYAFRDKSWTPIDVTIINDLADVKGVLEVRTIASGTVQSPIYRMPVDLPKSSRKRFQFQCYLQDASEIEARILEDGRRLFGFPMKINITPIDAKDLLMLVLDDSDSELGFGFVFDVSREDPSDERRFHRETLSNEKLSFLSAYPQTYDSFDLIILGKTDVARIGPAQQDILRDFVRYGGTLAVCLGEYADAYKGTWLEELCGITIGTKESINEAALAAECFPENLRTGAVDHRDVVVAQITPNDDNVRRQGETRTIATRRSLGSGHVYAIAVDADSHALQQCAGYRQIWSEMLVRRGQASYLNMDLAAQQTVSLLPSVSGVSIHSKEAVLIYLGLYFFVAIVANWLVFNRLKRRELAWLMLVIFSIGFTGYAMVFGTAGRARTSELEQIEVLHVPIGGGTSDLHALIGVLTARTGTYALTMGTENALIKDTAGFSLMSGPGYNDAATRARPFTFAQGPPNRIEGLRVGASEMRIMQVDSNIVVPNGIGGAITQNDDDSLTIDLVNETGFELEEPQLLFKGKAFKLSIGPDGRIKETLTEQKIRTTAGGPNTIESNPEVFDSRYAGRLAQNTDAETLFRRRVGAFKNEFVRTLFSTEGYFYDPRYYRGYGYPNQYVRGNEENPWAKQEGPILFAWVKNSPAGPIKPDQPVPTRIAATLLVAEVATAGKDIARYSDSPLPVGVSMDSAGFIGGPPMPVIEVEVKKLPVKIWISTDGVPSGAEITVEVGRDSFMQAPVEFVANSGADAWTREDKSANYGQVKTFISSTWDASTATIDPNFDSTFNKKQKRFVEVLREGEPGILWYDPSDVYEFGNANGLTDHPKLRIGGELRSDSLKAEFDRPRGERRMGENPIVTVRAYARIPIKNKRVSEGLWK
jgi:hypothetical protein